MGQTCVDVQYRAYQSGHKSTDHARPVGWPPSAPWSLLLSVDGLANARVAVWPLMFCCSSETCS